MDWEAMKLATEMGNLAPAKPAAEILTYPLPIIPATFGMKGITEAFHRMAKPGIPSSTYGGTSMTTFGKNVAKVDYKIMKTAAKMGAGAAVYAGATGLSAVGAMSVMNNVPGTAALAAGAAVAGAMNVNYAQPGFTRPDRVHNLEHKYNMGSSADIVFAMHNRR